MTDYIFFTAFKKAADGWTETTHVDTDLFVRFNENKKKIVVSGVELPEIDEELVFSELHSPMIEFIGALSDAVNKFYWHF